jgi:RimJ/RimL family protein N-acetyltransferase
MKFRVPEQLETDRLLLRQFLEPDWRELHAYYSDEAATKYTFGRALTEGESWRTMCGMIGHWQVRGYGPYALEEKGTGKLLGPVGFWYPNDWPEPEIKWGLARKHWGKGFAREAAAAVLAAAHEHLPELRLISLISTGNEASMKLALALGAHPERTIDFHGETVTIYRHRYGD